MVGVGADFGKSDRVVMDALVAIARQVDQEDCVHHVSHPRRLWHWGFMCASCGRVWCGAGGTCNEPATMVCHDDHDEPEVMCGKHAWGSQRRMVDYEFPSVDARFRHVASLWGIEVKKVEPPR